jgi:TonB-linked SusC/RagA family outer membrane protein
MNIQQFRCLLLFFCLLLGTGFARAQDTQKKTVSGNILNKDTREPLQGVTVNVRGTTQTVVSDAKGYFSITPPQRMKSISLTFSHVGFNSRSMTANLDEVLVVTMEVSNKAMDEVVVVGYGTQKKSNVLGAISTVPAKDIEDLPTANLSTALTNIVPGVGVTVASGKPGATSTITIRGAYTFVATGGSTSPLYVIDGLVPIISTGAGTVDPSGKTAFDLLDPSEIETITFLKDASATIYGARGANGVILVTTKRGRPGKPRVSYSGSYTAENASKMPQMIDGYNQALLVNNYVENYSPYKVVSTEIYTPAELDSIKAHNGNNTWEKSIWQPGYATRHTVNVSGGSDKFTYFVGGNYYNENGNIQSDTHSKYGVNMGMNAKVTDDLSIDLTMSFDNGYNNEPIPKGTTTTEQTDQENALFGAPLSTPSFIPETVGGQPYYYATTKFNPLAFLNSGSYTHDNSQTSQINVSVAYKIPFIKGLTLRGQYGRNTYVDLSKQWFVPYSAYNFYSPGVHTNIAPGTNKATGSQNVVYADSVTSTTKVSDGDQLLAQTNTSTNWQATEGIEYGNTWGKHTLDAAVYTEQQQTTGTYLEALAQTAVIPNIDQFYAYTASTDYNTGTNTSTGRVSYLGRLSYSYDNKYMLQGAFREDASPNFPTNHQWGFFPSVSVGWMASQEHWFQETFKGINDFKVRFNVGLTGNDAVPAFTWSTVYNATSPIGYLFGTSGNSPANGISSTSTVANPEITWERDLIKDLGFDGTFDQRRFHFTVDLFYKHGNNMLDAPTSSVPNTYGSGIANANYAELNSWGDEFQLGYNGHLNKDWSVFATVNFGFSIAGNNKVIREYYSAADTGYLYPIGERSDRGITGYKSTGIVRTQADVNAFYAKHPGWTINGDSLRVGDLNFQDVNGDGIINSNDETQIAKRTNNIFNMGYILGAQWKGLRLSTNIAMSIGGKKALSKTDITPPSSTASGLAMWSNSYTAANPNAPLPAIYAPFANQTSSFWLRSASYLYVNNLQLSYTLPPAMLGRYKIPEARIYMTGQNLWTIFSPTPYRDPRSNEITDYPILRTWTFGLNVNL